MLNATWRNRIAYAVLVVAVAASDAGYVHLQNERRHDDCMARQRTYDAFVDYSKFLGAEFDAPQARIDQGIARLRARHARPVCE